MKAFWPFLVNRFEGIEPELNRLDAATGDGDHGTTMLKGLRAAADAQASPAKAFRRASGGAGGTLFGFVVRALQNVIENGATLDMELGKAAEQIIQIGKAQPGDKTLLDALVPASEAGPSPAAAAEAAKTGLESTRAMAARSGRAKYVEGSGIGHLDAGAMSVAEILIAFANWKESCG
ncbi:MAG: DAK2 domain-containing protein [Albidovulum sp.]|nr:DAK2 domain-containing protein [Albidovulum sp.]MDE0529910.1 DAK2 domain-containing protein [Albidovulum sp.]